MKKSAVRDKKPTSTKQREKVIVLVAILILVAVWAINGYDDTWLYVTAILITAPLSWYYIEKNDKKE
jgi:hypothetical protein